MSNELIAGQLNARERQILHDHIRNAGKKPVCVLEVGTWMGGGSTLHILRGLHENASGHLWGIEANPKVFPVMVKNIQTAIPEATDRFTPLFGLSNEVIPKWLSEHNHPEVDLVFLDGGNNPNEQIIEFKLLEKHIPCGGTLMAHDARMRKGKWLVPYLFLLDNWQATLIDTSPEGLLVAHKIAEQPSFPSREIAERTLHLLRYEPFEMISRLIPPSSRKLLAHRLLPRMLAKRLIEGRKKT